ncbi:MAG TPA: holo-ACP synthase [Anaerolineae bacterium]|nr:holo-ACP synthase [Anaerolineae bacterium]
MNIGVDLIEIERVAHSIARFGDRFLQRVYTPQELAYCNGRIPSLAVRWAAKEAVAKALGTGIGDIGWQEIEIVSDARQCPSVRLHGAAAQLAAAQGITGFSISLSHTKDYAVAFVIGS